MAASEQSIADIVREALHDAQELVRSEMALARAEIRQEVSRVRTGAVALAGAAVAAVMALVFLLTTVAWAVTEIFQWPVWAGFGVVTVVALIAAAVLAVIGRSRLAGARHMPLTVDTMKENVKWMRARTS